MAAVHAPTLRLRRLDSVCGLSCGGCSGLRLVRQAARPPRCSDGLHNGDESATDCGGLACAACP